MECKNCKKHIYDCGYHYKSFITGLKNMDIPAEQYTDKVGDCYHYEESRTQSEIIKDYLLDRINSGKFDFEIGCQTIQLLNELEGLRYGGK